MKKHSKILLTIVCAVLLVVSAVLGTLAYFTDAEKVTNTFTVGKVGIELHETGEITRGDGTVGKDYHLLPGHTYPKDPTVTVDAGSENSYIRMLVTVNNYSKLKAAFPVNKVYGGNEVYKDWYAGDVLLIQYLVEGWDNTKWLTTGAVAVDTENDTAVYEFRYFAAANDKSGPAGDGVLEPLFTDIKVPGYVNNSELANLQQVSIDVVAHAIQAAGFDTAAEAWSAFDIQHP